MWLHAAAGEGAGGGSGTCPAGCKGRPKQRRRQQQQLQRRWQQQAGSREGVAEDSSLQAMPIRELHFDWLLLILGVALLRAFFNSRWAKGVQACLPSCAAVIQQQGLPYQ